MGSLAAPRVEPLGPSHDRAAFSCGIAPLDEYIRKQAAQDARRRVAQVFVAVDAEAGKIPPVRIPGYYTLSAASFEKASLPPRNAKRLPHYPVPAAILGRLAVDSAFRGQKLGEFLLFDAFSRVLQASQAMAVYALIVDAKDDRASRFYQRYGFIQFPSTPNRLFLPLETLARAAALA